VTAEYIHPLIVVTLIVIAAVPDLARFSRHHRIARKEQQR
jgi:hypothetical protein